MSRFTYLLLLYSVAVIIGVLLGLGIMLYLEFLASHNLPGWVGVVPFAGAAVVLLAWLNK